MNWTKNETLVITMTVLYVMCLDIFNPKLFLLPGQCVPADVSWCLGVAYFMRSLCKFRESLGKAKWPLCNATLSDFNCVILRFVAVSFASFLVGLLVSYVFQDLKSLSRKKIGVGVAPCVSRRPMRYSKDLKLCRVPAEGHRSEKNLVKNWLQKNMDKTISSKKGSTY
jgi:hypothetical protein